MKLKLRRARSAELPIVKAMWQKSCRMSESDCELFFCDVIKASHFIIAESLQSNSIAAAVCAIPAPIGGEKAIYLYGAAERRAGSGAAYEMIRSLCAWGNKHNCAILLKPSDGNEKLHFHADGFRPAAFYDYVTVLGDKAMETGTHMIIRDIDVEEYVTARREFAEMRGGVLWDDNFVRFGVHNFVNKGGRVIKVRCGFSRFAALLTTICRGVVLSEALADPPDVEFALSRIAHRYKAIAAYAFVPSVTANPRHSAAMIYKPRDF